MSEMRLIQILCDFGEDCEADAGGQWANATVARELAAKRGWSSYEVGGDPWAIFKRSERFDFCPEHGGAS